MSAFIKWSCDICGNSTEKMVPLDKEDGSIDSDWGPSGWGWHDGKTYCWSCNVEWRKDWDAKNPDAVGLA